jgi:hypothetical protein
VRAASIPKAIKPEAFYDCGVIIRLETTNASAGMIHQKPADEVILITQAVGVNTIG